MRVPAGEIDGLILDRLRALLTSPVEVAKSLDPLNLETRWLDPVLRRAAEIGRKWSTLPTENLRALVLKIVDRVNIAPDRIEITIGLTRLAQALGAEDDVAVNRPKSTVVLSIKAKLRRAGKGKCMVIGEQLREQANPSLVRLMQEAFAAKALLLADTDESINAISARIGKCKGRLTSLVRLSYLAPSIVEDILAGRHPVEMSAKRLLRPSKDLPFDWLDQRKFLGLSS